MNRAESQWEVSAGILVTRLQGMVTVDDVGRWRSSLEEALAHIEGNSRFRLLVDLHGYEPAAIQAHKEMRSIIPLTLARYGFRTALLDLFEPIEMALQATNGITCTAVAHVHHDESKMAEYARRIGRDNEQFFSDPDAAWAWLQTL